MKKNKVIYNRIIIFSIILSFIYGINFEDIVRIEINKDRLYQEVALILEKKDINEEISRLQGHLKLLNSFLKTKDVNGKKISFLLQEINREINTIGSKADNLKIRHFVVDVKNNTEKIKEQVQNII